MSAKETRLQMIQGIINRLAGNSSAFKGWMVTITSALLGVAINNKKEYLGWLAVYGVSVLGVLDAYYLALERSYRQLYKTAAAQNDQTAANEEDKWSLCAQKVNLGNVLCAVFSPSIWPFYLSGIIVSVIVATRV